MRDDVKQKTDDSVSEQLKSKWGASKVIMPVGIEYCLTASPIYFDSVKQVDETPFAIQRQILEHNVTYERLCEK